MADISQIYHNGVLYGLEDKTARKLSPLNIKSFGAKGDGMTDDTEAIILAAECGAPVFFPCGTYLLSRQIDVSKNICFYGEGECSLIKLIPADQSRTEENDDGVTVYTCNMFFSDENTPAKLELRNLSLDASKADYSNDVLNNGSSKNDITRCIYLNYPESIKFSGVSLKNSTADGALIICGNATKVNIENCRFDSCGFSNNAANGLTIEGGNSVSVSNCSFDKNSGNGLSVSTVNSYYSNVKASDNGYDGIFICNGARDNAFNGVHCCKNRSGIFIKSDNDLSHIDYGRLEQPTHNTFCNTVCENNVYGIMLGASKDTILNGFCSRDDYFYAICCNCEITGHLYNENISASIGYGYDFTGGDIT
ncbi:MAG: right-handed parallel beta-helix repeat-containing protein, partial [Clostridia bacterium]|nr:right-handed parallel beta-helix repeat-containing protein [Clostridia bacterium]